MSDKIEIDELWFNNCKCVGISAGASTPDYLIEDVTKRIKNYDKELSSG